MVFEYNVTGGDFARAGYVSSNIKKVLKQLNQPSTVIKRVTIALYEAEVNVVAHALEGKAYIDINEERVEITMKDKGPGIPDIPKAMERGFSTATRLVREMGFGAGMGLHNIKINAHKFEIKSTVNVGTVVKIVVYLNEENGEQGQQ